MTLVVARSWGDHLVVSDAMSTDLHGTTSPRRDVHQLKAVILSRRFCVAFAGRISRAQVALAGWQEGSDLRATIEHFLRVHRDSHGDPDFLIASWGERLCLTRIRRGQAEEELSVAHVGSAAAFSAFQEHVAVNEKPAEFADDKGARLCNAMDAVITGGRFPDVGGFAVHVRSCLGGFRYMERDGSRRDRRRRS